MESGEDDEEENNDKIEGGRVYQFSSPVRPMIDYSVSLTLSFSHWEIKEKRLKKDPIKQQRKLRRRRKNVAVAICPHI